MARTPYWTFERCKESAAQYKHITDWIDNAQGAYKASVREGWIDDVTKHMSPKITLYWNFERCFKDAQNYLTKADWIEASPSAYASAKNHKEEQWLEKCTAHMTRRITKPRPNWKEKTCYIDALLYPTYTKWRVSSSAYRAAKRKGWIAAIEARLWDKELLEEVSSIPTTLNNVQSLLNSWI